MSSAMGRSSFKYAARKDWNTSPGNEDSLIQFLLLKNKILK